MLSFLLELARIRLLLKLNRNVLKLARCQLKLARHVGKLACPLLKLTRISLLKSGIIKQKRDSKQYLKLLAWCNYNTCMVEVSSRIIAREIPSVGRVYNQLRLHSTMLSFLLKL